MMYFINNMSDTYYNDRLTGLLASRLSDLIISQGTLAYNILAHQPIEHMYIHNWVHPGGITQAFIVESFCPSDALLLKRQIHVFILQLEVFCSILQSCFRQEFNSLFISEIPSLNNHHLICITHIYVWLATYFASRHANVR
jgi:hypothetical protein